MNKVLGPQRGFSQTTDLPTQASVCTLGVTGERLFLLELTERPGVEFGSRTQHLNDLSNPRASVSFLIGKLATVVALPPGGS